MDNGTQLNFITPAYAIERGMDIMSLDRLAQEIGGQLPHIKGMGGNPVEPIGFVLMNVKVPCVRGYDEDQVTLVMDDPEMSECPVILGTSTLYWVMEVIKESEISKLAVPWSSSRLSWLMQDVMARLGQVVVNDVANKPIAPLDVDEVVRVASKCTVPPFGHKVIHGKVNLVLHGCRLNVMTHGLEKRLPSLPLGIDVQTAYATLANGSHRVPVVLRNNTQDWLKIKKGVPIARMVTANAIHKVTHILPAEKPHEQSTLTEAERQELLLEKLDLTGLEAWPGEQAEKACSLLKEYHDIFSLEKHDMGHTKATKHKIVLKVPDTPPFKERFRRIPPPQLDEVRAHLKMMLDAGVIQPSNSPWCNAVVLVRKKDGSLHFCIDFRRLNALTVKDSHPLPRICETLESLACSGPGELLHVDFTSIEETVPLHQEPVIRNVMVMQDHFSKYVVAYVVKDQTARTATEILRNGYFDLFGAPAYLVSDQGKAFTGHLISILCELYGVQKLRTSPYHAQTNRQVERMNQTIIRMIGKLEEDKKARWSEHLPEMLSAYNGIRSAVTGYSPYFLLFGRKSRMPVDCLFPTLCDSPHQAKMEVSVAAMQKVEGSLHSSKAPRLSRSCQAKALL